MPIRNQKHVIETDDQVFEWLNNAVCVCAAQMDRAATHHAKGIL